VIFRTSKCAKSFSSEFRNCESGGTTLPARVTPAGDAIQAAELHAQFAAITEPAAQTAFWRKLTPEQQALILKHQA